MNPMANKTFMKFILQFVENCLWYDSIHDSYVLLKTSSADIKRFRIQAGKTIAMATNDFSHAVLKKTFLLHNFDI